MLSTSDLSRALNGIVNVNRKMVAGWCERGILDAVRNPATNRGHWMIKPASLPEFLKKSLMLSEADLNAVIAKIDQNARNV